MPKSDPCNKKPIIDYILRKINSNNLKSIEIIDLGVGVGDFGKLIKENVNIPVKVTGVEIWNEYENEQWKYYDKIIIEDIKDFIKKNKKRFDIVLLIDILEHFNKTEGRKILKDVISRAKRAIILSTPITRYPQGVYKGNPYEEHRSVWKDEELLSMGFKRIFRKWIRTSSSVFWPPFSRLGVYVFEK